MEIKVPINKTWKKQKDGSYTGNLAFTFSDTTIRITDDDGNDVASMAAGMGCSIWFRIKDDRELDHNINPYDLWEAYCKAVGREDLIVKRPKKDGDSD
jgi:hypothetical protein